MKEIIQTIKSRRSVRRYLSTPVPEELLATVLEAGTYAPTGRNLQSPCIVAVEDPNMRDKLSQMNASIMGTQSDPFYGAPVVLVVFADTSVPTWQEDGSLVMGNLLLAAHAVGLGSCWIHRAREMFKTPEGIALKKEWAIPDTFEGIGNCILGYADEVPPLRPRKDNYIIRIK